MSTNSKDVQRKADAKRKGKRAAAWTAIVYEESAPDGWRDILKSWGVDWLVSPLHDRDVDEDGTPKKPHRHVIVVFDSAASRTSAKEIFDSFGAVMAPENDGHGVDKSKVRSLGRAARYLCHMDDPGKAQYSKEDVETAVGLDYEAMTMTRAEEDALLDEIEDFVERNCIVSFITLERYARLRRRDWQHLLRRKAAYYVRELCKANQWAVANSYYIETTEFADAGEQQEAAGESGCEAAQRSGATTTLTPGFPSSK